jgi:TatD DNase family protein
MKIIDAHSHLDYITHNFQTDVVGTVCCATKESEWKTLVDKIKTDKKIYGCFGIHPWFVQDTDDGFEIRLESLLISNDSFMVGEIGLDKYKPDMDKQIDVFQKQFDVAIKLNRSVVLHCVGAWDKILHILKQYKKSELPIIIAHDFHGSDEILNILLENYNICFSFNKIDKPQEINRIQQIPLCKILVETDAKDNISLKEIVDTISGIKNEPYADKIIYENTLRILNNEQIA